jgi:esterase/lipase superfamily enzyme
MLRRGSIVFVFAVLALLSACERYQLTGYSEPLPGATVEPIFVATQRKMTQFGPIFGEKRSPKMNYLRYNVSIPPIHELGEIERTSGVADPQKFFATLGIDRYPARRDFITALKRHRAGDGGLVLFVHGYNNTLEDAAFRLAQIRNDFDIAEPALLFSWPSAGDPRGYIYDRDSVLFARDGFEQLLRDLRASGERNVLLVAHSLGGYLAMETLRQIALKGDRRVLDMLAGVVLMSPDIDPDVFRQQAQDIGKLPQPFLIMTSRKDKVLGLAGLLTGRKPRLGGIDGPEAVKGLDVTVMDFTAFDTGKEGGHDTPFTSVKAIKLMRGLDNEIEGGRRAMRDFVLRGKERHGLLVQ